MGRSRTAADPLRTLPAMLVAALPQACAATLAILLSCRSGRTLDVARLAARLHRGRTGALQAVDEAEAALHSLVGVHILPPQRPWFETPRTSPDVAPNDAGIPEAIQLNDRFVDLLERPRAPIPTTVPPPRCSPDVAMWIGAIAAAARSDGALHLALRCRTGPERELSDLAALLAVAGTDMVLLESGHRGLAADLLRAEFHGDGAHATAVVIRPGGLLEVADGERDDGIVDGRAGAEPTPFVWEAMPWLPSLRSVCLWCVPEDALIPAVLDALVAGCVGPIILDAAFAHDAVAEAIGGGVGRAGVAAIAATLQDPRDASARGRAARLLAAGGMPIDDACGAVARSFVPGEAPTPEPVGFDLELHSDDPEIALLFARAREVALAGGRLLFHGPPGGGKTTLCRALAAEMARAGAAGPPLNVTAAGILVRPLGGTERILKELWRRASISRSPLVIDELDAMCGVRDPSASGGNAYLVRMLTDEWIRNFDAHPQVPVLATVNDLAVDPAIIRRFTGQHHVGGTLPPSLERRAWTSLLGMDPPPGWKPCGACPSDFDSARKRCRMLGLEDAASLAASVERAREARCGSRPGVRRPTSAGPLH